MSALPKRAILLAAGQGTRLGALTKKTPKCLLPVRGRPMLAHWLSKLDALGVERVLINTHHLAKQVGAFAAAWRGQPELTLAHEPKLLGSAGTIFANRAFLETGPAFWIVYADTLVTADLKPLVRLHDERQADLTLGLFRAPDPKAVGIVEVDADGKAVSFEEKPARPRGSLAFAGIALGSRAFLDRLPRPPADLARDVLGRSLDGVYGLELGGAVIDIGTLESYGRVNG